MQSIFRFTSAMLLVSASIASGSVVTEDKAALAWLRLTAVLFSDTTPTDAEFSVFLPRLDGAKVIGIGEATHGDHQDQAFKAELIKALVRSGRIDTLALECNLQAGSAFNAYVRDGTGEPTKIIRSKSFFSTWHDDEFAGLILWLRAWNTTATKPVRIVGIDNQDALRDVRIAIAFIRTRDADLAARLSAGIGPMASDAALSMPFFHWVVATPKGDYQIAQNGVRQINDALVAHRNEWTQFVGYDEATYAARVAAQGLNVFELEAGAPDFDLSKAPAEYVRRRDVFMAANLIELVGADHHAALWAHDDHIYSDPGAAAEGFARIGTELRSSLGKAYVSIGFAWSQGSFNSKQVKNSSSSSMVAASEWSAFSLPNNRPQDDGYLLAKVGAPRFWLDLRNPPVPALGWLSRPLFRGWVGAVVDPQNWQSDQAQRAPLLSSFDFLIYFNTITPSHRWPKQAD